LTIAEAEHGAPAWIQGARSYAWAEDSIYYLLSDLGFHSLWHTDLDGRTRRVDGLDDYSDLSQIAVSPRSGQIALLASAATIPPRVISYAPEAMPLPERLSAESPGLQVIVDDAGTGVRVHRRSSTENWKPEQLAPAEAISWTGHDGEMVHGIYNAPTHESYTSQGAPPLLVMVHGGPTSQMAARWDATTQFFTSRGFAVVYVNYRGSSGYGRVYRNKLRASWGIYDVEDSASAARHLVDQGLADPARLVIYGGSAGGYTVLQSLVDKPGFYKAAICLYGVADQFALAMETHKFEARYSDSLLGPLPEAADLYRARSPIFHAEKIVDPVAVYQGADDKVVPRSQSDRIVASLKARGIPHQYTVYEGEGHGFRKAETLEAYFRSVYQFLLKYVIYS
jgi:dipeptidyl aminopeptidase/acylaminoacyl peptidase